VSTSAPTYPKWLRDILHLMPIRSQFVLSGGIRDQVLVGDPVPQMMSLRSALWRALEPLGFEGLLIWDRIDGLQAYPPDPKRLEPLNRVSDVNLASAQLMNLRSLARVMRRVTGSDAELKVPPRVALLIDYSSRLRDEGHSPEEVHEFFIAAEKAALESRPLSGAQGAQPLFNPVLWLANRPNDLPYWFTVDNERVRSIPIGVPDADTRRRAARLMYPMLPEGKRDIPVDTFADTLARLTHNMSLNALADIVSLGRRQGLNASDIDDAVQGYRVGDLSMASPWRGSHLRGAIERGEEVLAQRVRGQTKAVSKVLDILKRTSIGLTGAQTGNSGARPRGVLFFAGPTGVGKTEMAKSIAQVVFGDESAYLRFDMSEFSAEHSGDRLIGAPPGYVGFDQGGELTNALRERPFRVVLFDEIEKAHPRILDKFLQVLEDGRLTDGRGETVYFSEALIIFTSNLGISRELPNGTVEVMVSPNDPPEEFERKLMDGIRDHFVRRLQRPELLNRIGENVVIFNFITPEVGREILDTMLGNVRQRILDERQISLEIAPEVLESLRVHCTRDLSNGGRGIGAKLEAVFINPLARLLFSRPPQAGNRVLITALEENHGIYRLQCAD